MTSCCSIRFFHLGLRLYTLHLMVSTNQTICGALSGDDRILMKNSVGEGSFLSPIIDREKTWGGRHSLRKAQVCKSCSLYYYSESFLSLAIFYPLFIPALFLFDCASLSKPLPLINYLQLNRQFIPIQGDRRPI